MASVNPPWFHGQLSRAAAESRLSNEAPKFPVGTTLFLIRKSSSHPKDFVLTSLIVGREKITNLIIEVAPGPPVTYSVEMAGQRGPSFLSLQDFITHYSNPTSGLTGGPLQTWVADPTNQPRQPAPQPVQQQPILHQQAVQPAAPQPVQAVSEIQQIQAAQPVFQPGAVNPVNVSLQAPLSTVVSPAVRNPELAPSERVRSEGYLTKIRGVGQNRKRFFQLTTENFTYFSEDAGEVIHSCPVTEIQAVSDVSKTRFRVITTHPFGSGSGASTEVLLECPNVKIKNKWLNAFQSEENQSGGLRKQQGKLVGEGYLTKVQPMGTTNKTRWFVLTTDSFAYYKEEADEMMGCVSLDNITTISAPGDSKEFRILSNARFTVTGAFEVLCRAESKSVRNKWIVNFQKVLSPEKFQR